MTIIKNKSTFRTWRNIIVTRYHHKRKYVTLLRYQKTFLEANYIFWKHFYIYKKS